MVENESREVLMWNKAFVEMFVRTDKRPLLAQCYNACSSGGPTELAPMQRSLMQFVSTLGIDSLFADPSAFHQRLTQLWARHEMVLGDEIPLLDGRVVRRDFIPLKEETLTKSQAAPLTRASTASSASRGSGFGSLWVIRDITEERNVQKALFDAALQGRNEFLAFIWYWL